MNAASGPGSRESFLSDLESVVRDLVRAEFGERALAPSSLAAAIREQSETYTLRRSEISARATEAELIARLAFFLERDVLKITYPFAELIASRPPSETGKSFSLLDVGAGLGATTLGAAWMLGQRHDRIECTLVDRDPRTLRLATQVLTRMKDRGLKLGAIRTIESDVVAATASLLSGKAAGPQLDAVVCGFVVNEMSLDLGAREKLIDSFVSVLGQNGAVVILEPALRESTRELMKLRDVFAGKASRDTTALHVFAPCVHANPCPMLVREHDWCHENRPFMFPDSLRERARSAGLRYEDLTFSYLTLTRAAVSSRSLLEPREGTHPYRVVSDPIVTKGKAELDICGERGLVRLRGLDRDKQSARLEAFDRGALVSTPPADGPSRRLSPDDVLEGPSTL